TNDVTVTAADRLARTGSDSRRLHLDTIKPKVTIVKPTTEEQVGGQTIEVSGTVEDTSPIRQVRVGSVVGSLEGTHFVVHDVPIGGSESAVEIVVEAEDVASNVGEGKVKVRVDRTAPVVEVQSPDPGAYRPGPTLEVKGTVSDDSPVMVEVNGHPEEPPPSL